MQRTVTVTIEYTQQAAGSGIRARKDALMAVFNSVADVLERYDAALDPTSLSLRTQTIRADMPKANVPRLARVLAPQDMNVTRYNKTP